MYHHCESSVFLHVIQRNHMKRKHLGKRLGKEDRDFYKKPGMSMTTLAI